MIQISTIRNERGDTQPYRNKNILSVLWIIILIQFLSHIGLLATPWIVAHKDSPSFTISWSLFRFMSIELVMLSNHLIHPMPPPSPFAFNLSHHQSLSQQVALCIRWLKYCTLASASVFPMNIQDWFPFRLTDFTFFAFRYVCYYNH